MTSINKRFSLVVPRERISGYNNWDGRMAITFELSEDLPNRRCDSLSKFNADDHVVDLAYKSQKSHSFALRLAPGDGTATDPSNPLDSVLPCVPFKVLFSCSLPIIITNPICDDRFSLWPTEASTMMYTLAFFKSIAIKARPRSVCTCCHICRKLSNLT